MDFAIQNYTFGEMYCIICSHLWYLKMKFQISNSTFNMPFFQRRKQSFWWSYKRTKERQQVRWTHSLNYLKLWNQIQHIMIKNPLLAIFPIPPGQYTAQFWKQNNRIIISHENCIRFIVPFNARKVRFSFLLNDPKV